MQMSWKEFRGRRNGGRVRGTFRLPNMCKSISGKRYLDSFIKLSSQQNTQQTMEGRGDRAVVNMKSSPAVQRGDQESSQESHNLSS